MKDHFKRGENPREAIGIGRGRDRKFSSFSELLDFIVYRAPEEILGIPDWPESIKGNIYGVKMDNKSIEERGEIINKLKEWIENHVSATVMGRVMGGKEINRLFSIRSYLLSQFSKGKLAKTVRESLEFRRGGDPRDTLEIGRVVNVKGDRGYGEYRVRLIEKHQGDDISEDEEVWKARVIPSGRIVFVIKYDHIKYHSRYSHKNRNFWGVIDPFIFESAKSIGFIRGEDPKKSLGIGISSKMKNLKEEEIPEFIYKYGPALMGFKEWPSDFFSSSEGPIINPKYAKVLLPMVFNDINIAKYSDNPAIILVNILEKLKREVLNKSGKIRESVIQKNEEDPISAVALNIETPPYDKGDIERYGDPVEYGINEYPKYTWVRVDKFLPDIFIRGAIKISINILRILGVSKIIYRNKIYSI